VKSLLGIWKADEENKSQQEFNRDNKNIKKAFTR